MTGRDADDVRRLLAAAADRAPVRADLLDRVRGEAEARRRRRGRVGVAATGLATVLLLSGVATGLPGRAPAPAGSPPATALPTAPSTALPTTPPTTPPTALPTAAPTVLPTTASTAPPTAAGTAAPTAPPTTSSAVPRWGRPSVDDFGTGALDEARWSPYPDGVSGTYSRWSEREVAVAGGELRLTVRPSGSRYASGGVGTIPDARTYGRWTVRLRMTPGQGVLGQVLLVEAGSSYAAYLATLADDRKSLVLAQAAGRSVRVPADLTGFGVLAVEWSPGLLRWTLDGRELARFTERVPDGPLWLAVQTLLSGPDCGAVPPAAGCRGPLPLPQVLAVDRVTVQPYQP